MCGIVGFTGHAQAAPILLDGLARLEYRGYDSAGLAVRNGAEPAEVVKATGKLSAEAPPAPGLWTATWSACTTALSRTSPS